MNKEFINEAAKAAHAKLPDNYGFIILAAPFGAQGDDNRLMYASNLKRPDAILVLKEWLIKSSGEDEWMKHIR